MALFAVSALVLGLARRRLEKAGAYRAEAAARSAALSGLARARLGLEGEAGESYAGESLTWPGGQSAEVRVLRLPGEDEDFEVTVRGSASGPDRPATRSLRAVLELRGGRVWLREGSFIPRAELAQLRR